MAGEIEIQVIWTTWSRGRTRVLQQSSGCTLSQSRYGLDAAQGTGAAADATAVLVKDHRVVAVGPEAVRAPEVVAVVGQAVVRGLEEEVKGLPAAKVGLGQESEGNSSEPSFLQHPWLSGPKFPEVCSKPCPSTSSGLPVAGRLEREVSWTASGPRTICLVALI